MRLRSLDAVEDLPGVWEEGMNKEITTRQAEVLGAIRASILKTGRPPTYREISASCGIASTNGVRRHLEALQRKGYITREHSLSRSIALTGGAEVAPGQTLRDVSMSAFHEEATRRGYVVGPKGLAC